MTLKLSTDGIQRHRGGSCGGKLAWNDCQLIQCCPINCGKAALCQRRILHCCHGRYGGSPNPETVAGIITLEGGMRGYWPMKHDLMVWVPSPIRKVLVQSDIVATGQSGASVWLTTMSTPLHKLITFGASKVDFYHGWGYRFRQQHVPRIGRAEASSSKWKKKKNAGAKMAHTRVLSGRGSWDSVLWIRVRIWTAIGNLGLGYKPNEPGKLSARTIFNTEIGDWSPRCGRPRDKLLVPLCWQRLGCL